MSRATRGKQAAIAAMTLLGSLAWAQTEGPAPAPVAADGGWLQGSGALIAIVAIAVVVVVVVAFALLSRRPEMGEVPAAEPERRSSKFEPLLAEIQGLSLRVKGGESRGYSHKIDQLVRAFMERMGYKGARNMSEDELRETIEKGNLAPETATALLEIYNTCRRQAESERGDIDFSAAELLRQLQAIILKIEAGAARQES